MYLEVSRTMQNEIYVQEDEINTANKIIIAASELDNHTERIVNYSTDSEISIIIVLFNVIDIDGNIVLSRVWLIDPSETDQSVLVGRG